MALSRILAAASLIAAAGIVSAQQPAKQPTGSKPPVEHMNVVPFGEGFCRLEESSLLVYAPPETVFDAYVVEVKGEPEQRYRPTGDNPYTKGSVAVQLLSRTKGPLGPARELNLTGSKWSSKLETIDLTFSAGDVRAVVHAISTGRGLRVQRFECTSAKSPKR